MEVNMLKLREEQLRHLEQLEGNDFLVQVRDAIVQDIPSLKDEPLLSRLQAANDHAGELGLSEQAALTQFLYTEAIAPDFYLDPQVDTWLRKPGQPVEQRLNDLLATMQTQLASGAH